MAVVVDLDALGRLLEAEGRLHAFQQPTLGNVLGQPSPQGLPGIGERVLHQLPPASARRFGDLDLASRLDGERLAQQGGLGRHVADQDQRRRGLVGIELSHEAGHHPGRRQVPVMAGEIAAVAEIAAAAEEEDLDAGLAAVLMGRDHVGVCHAFDIDVLMRLDEGERLQPVAQGGRALEVQGFACRLHLCAQARLHIAALAREKILGQLDQAQIVRRRDPVHAGRRTALDLVEQAGSRTVGEDAVGAGAEQEGALQRSDGPMDRAGRGEGAVVIALPVARAPVLGDLRRGGVAGDQDVGERLVVAQQHVVARHQLLDQVDLEQQRLQLGMGDDHFEARGLGHHAAQTLGQLADLGIGGDPLLQVARLADIECVARFVQHAIDTGAGRQIAQRLDDDPEPPGDSSAGARNPAVPRGFFGNVLRLDVHRIDRYPRNLWTTV